MMKLGQGSVLMHPSKELSGQFTYLTILIRYMADPVYGGHTHI